MIGLSISNSLVSLETHLNSCEVYECYEFEEKVNNVTDIKLHIAKEHDKANKFCHLKMNRMNPEEVDLKEYSLCDV
jgi:protein-arginine kinase